MPVTHYKKVEKEFADRINAWFRRIWISLLNLFTYVMQKGKQRFTVMIIPHAEKKIFNLQISFFTLIFLASTLSVVLVGFFFLAMQFEYSHKRITEVTQELQSDERTLVQLKDEISGIRKAGRIFKTQTDGLLRNLGNKNYSAAGIGGESLTYIGAAATESGSLKELSELRSVTSLIENSIKPLDEISRLLSTFKDFSGDTPTLWPLKGVSGIVTTRFGWTTNPFTKVGYMHTGIDIAWSPGTPIVAAANGTVIQIGTNDQLGNFVVIGHKYGFSTRYSHLSGFATRKGATVARGDTIGYLGNTGWSTGPHLDYVVRLGSIYLDPMNFLLIRPNLAALKNGGGSD